MTDQTERNAAEDLAECELPPVEAPWWMTPTTRTWLQYWISRAVAEREARVKAERELIAWRSAIQRLTPGGSEFTSPDAVLDFAVKQKNEYYEAKKDLVKTKAELAAARDQLEFERTHISPRQEFKKAGGQILVRVAIDPSRDDWEPAKNWELFNALQSALQELAAVVDKLDQIHAVMCDCANSGRAEKDYLYTSIRQILDASPDSEILSNLVERVVKAEAELAAIKKGVKS